MFLFQFATTLQFHLILSQLMLLAVKSYCLVIHLCVDRLTDFVIYGLFEVLTY